MQVDVADEGGGPQVAQQPLARVMPLYLVHGDTEFHEYAHACAQPERAGVVAQRVTGGGRTLDC